MKRFTVSQVDRALGQEQLLRRVEGGELFEDVCREIGLSLCRGYLPRLRQRYRQGGSSWVALVDHRCGHASKVMPERRAWLCQQKRERPALTQEQLAQRFQEQFGVVLSQSQVSNILRAEGAAFPGGQRRHQEKAALPVERAGVFFPPGRRTADGGVEHRDAGRPPSEGGLSGA
jgi:transposase